MKFAVCVCCAVCVCVASGRQLVFAVLSVVALCCVNVQSVVSSFLMENSTRVVAGVCATLSLYYNGSWEAASFNNSSCVEMREITSI